MPGPQKWLLMQALCTNVKALLFDCYGTLVNAEYAASLGSCRVINQMLSQRNIAKQVTSEELMTRFPGRKFDDMVAGISADHAFSVSADELTALNAQDEEAVVASLQEHVKSPADDGLASILFELQGQIPLAIVSSSSLLRVKTCLRGAGLEDCFSDDHIFGAATLGINPKPDPAIYLHALKSLGVSVLECMAFEDSRQGIRSALAANIQVVGYVGTLPAEKQDVQVGALLSVGARFGLIKHWNQFWPFIGSTFLARKG